jgi:hypothetical protein
LCRYKETNILDESKASTFSAVHFFYTALRMEAICSSEILVPLFQRFANGVLRNAKVPRGEKKDSVRKFITVQNKTLKALLF